MVPFAIAGIQMRVSAEVSNVDYMAGRLAVVMHRFPWVQMVLFSELCPHGPVTRDKISGAIAAYMLMAVAWAGLYGLTGNLVPGSFSLEGQSDVDRPRPVQELLFFSFTTLTTIPAAGTSPPLPATPVSLDPGADGRYLLCGDLDCPPRQSLSTGSTQTPPPYLAPWRPRQPPILAPNDKQRLIAAGSVGLRIRKGG